MEAPMRDTLTGTLAADAGRISGIFHAETNGDFIERTIALSGVEAILFYIDGMAGARTINEHVIMPMQRASLPADLAGAQRAEYLIHHVISICDASCEDRVKAIVGAILEGRSALLIDGCDEAVLLETRAFEKRSVDRAQTEPVVIGAQQGFVENLRTNLTLLHRIIRTPAMMVERIDLGVEIPTAVSLVYLKDVVNEKALAEVRRRIRSLNIDFVPDSGQLQALIEDSPMQLFPQMLETERPDRAAECITNGQIAIMVDNSPYALIAPITVFHLLHAADDTYMRWQYGTFIRILRIFGLTLSLFLPAVYVALTTYHTHMIPLDLLTSIAETRAKVPFPVLVEILIMEVSFYLINEAGTRIPAQIGSALGIVGALILGQAAVTANIISPILIIIVALTGLGNYTAPTYGMGVAIQIMRLGMLLAGAAFGLFGIALVTFVYLCALGAMHSFGVPMLAPYAPYRRHNPDLILRLPLFLQTKLLFIANQRGWLRRTPDNRPVRGWKGGGT